MEIRLLANGYKDNEQLYTDFLNDQIDYSKDYFSNQTVQINEAPDFPIYIATKNEIKRKNEFFEAFRVISKSYLDLDRDLIMDGTFWHSLLITQKRDYILQKYPTVKNSYKDFKNIVLKKFDWENYIYKCILATQYINDNINDNDTRNRYYELIINNLDVFNYIIKYPVFRNEKFLINILDIIDELNISKLAKAEIKGRDDLGKDERYGRRVIFELNKSYPVIMAPMIDKEELKKYFIIFLNYYYDVTKIIPEEEIPEEILVNKGSDQIDSFNKQSLVYRDSEIDKETPIDAISKINQTSSTVLTVEPKLETLINDSFKQKEKSDAIISFLNDNNLTYIDNRSIDGSIWVIGNKSIESYLIPLKQKGIQFRYKPIGSRVTKFRASWVLSEN